MPDPSCVCVTSVSPLRHEELFRIDKSMFNKVCCFFLNCKWTVMGLYNVHTFFLVSVYMQNKFIMTFLANLRRNYIQTIKFMCALFIGL